MVSCLISYLEGLSRWLSCKESACQTGNIGDEGSIPGKIPWRRKWQPTSVFLPGEFHWQKSLVGYSPWDHKKLVTTVHTHTILFLVSNLNHLPQFASKSAHCWSLNGLTPDSGFCCFSRIVWVVFSWAGWVRVGEIACELGREQKLWQSSCLSPWDSHIPRKPGHVRMKEDWAFCPSLSIY